MRSSTRFLSLALFVMAISLAHASSQTLRISRGSFGGVTGVERRIQPLQIRWGANTLPGLYRVYYWRLTSDQQTLAPEGIWWEKHEITVPAGGNPGGGSLEFFYGPITNQWNTDRDAFWNGRFYGKIEHDNNGFKPQASSPFVTIAQGQTIWDAQGDSTTTLPLGIVYLPGIEPPPADDENSWCPPEPCVGMARASVDSLHVALVLTDTPLAYQPAFGPSMQFKAFYQQLDRLPARQSQQATAGFSHLGPGWSFNWLSYISDTPGGTGPVTMIADGFKQTFNNFDSGTQSYAAHRDTRAVLKKTGPASYRLDFADGSAHVYAQADGANTAPRRVYLTQVIDPQGHAVTLTYGGGSRLTKITDATTGRWFDLFYEPANYYQIKKVVDSAGPETVFEYADGKLDKIIDPVGITSQFTYASAQSTLITHLTTPYGVTTLNTGGIAPNRFVEITDPLGGKERYEYREWTYAIPDSEPVAPPGFENSGLSRRNTFYWSKKAMDEIGNGALDYSKAEVTQWLTRGSGTAARTTGVPHSVKKPLESRVWYSYLGQTNPKVVGTMGLPSRTARVLDDGSSQETQATYNARGLITESIDPRGRKLTFDYDSTLGLDLMAIRQTRNGADVFLLSFPNDQNGAAYANHRPLRMKDAAGQETRFTYNSRDQLETVTNAKNEVTKTVYHPQAGSSFARVSSITAAFGTSLASTTTFTYDSYGRLDVFTYPDGNSRKYGYDAIDGNPNKTLHRVARITYPGPPPPNDIYEETTFNRLDPHFVRDRLGRYTEVVHDALRRVKSVTLPGNLQTNYEWCICGALEQVIDPEFRLTQWNRDTQGRMTEKIIENQVVATYMYENTTSRLKTITDALSQVTTYGYYADDRLASISYTNVQKPTPNVTFAWDADYPRLANITTAGLAPLTYGYVPFNRTDAVYGDGQVQSIAGYFSDLTSYTYDELGRQATRTLNGTSTWNYDALGRLSGWSSPLGAFVPQYATAPNGAPTPRLNLLSYPNGIAVDYDWYDQTNDFRLKEIHNLPPGGATMTKYNYASEVEGWIWQWKQQRGTSPVKRWELDPSWSDQLLAVRIRDDATNVLERDYSYEYDLSGNWMKLIMDGSATTWESDQFNQLTTQTNPARSFVYDLNGAMTNNGAGQTYEWDGADRLVAINYTGSGQRTEFAYDGLGRRVKIIEKTNGSVTSQKGFVWEGLTIVQELYAFNSLTKRYYPEGQIEDNGYYGYPGYQPTKLFYTRDHLGSIRSLWSPSGTTAYDFDPYGRKSAGYGYYTTSFDGFTGHYHHGPSGLTLAPFRAYDANLGRWLNRDPIGEAGGINLYGYVGNDPINLIDPLGLYIYPSDFIGPLLPGDSRMPVGPPGASVDRNMGEAARHSNPYWFRDQVKNKGPWDYKQQGPQYQDFGNFNYGACGAAFGFSPNTLCREAGRAQQAAGTSQPGWGDPGSRVNPWGGTSPYGDDPADQQQIRNGIEYYRQTHPTPSVPPPIRLGY